MSLKPSARTEVRRNMYKVSAGAAEGRRRREDEMVEIRKNKREENLQKKRREGLTASIAHQGQDLYSYGRLENITQLVAEVTSEDRRVQLDATIGIRKLLSDDYNPSINEVIQSGVVPRLVKFLSSDDFPQLQFEAAWALTNIASGTSDNTKVIIDSGAIPLFITLLASPCDDVREQAAWALGNVAGDSQKFRDHVLSFDAMTPLLAQFNEHTKPSILRNASWTLSNFCRGKPQPALEQTNPALPVLERLLHSTDDEVLTDACWTLSFLSDGDNDRIQTVINAGVVPRLVQLLAHHTPSVVVPALRTIGNIVTGDDIQTQEVLNHQALPRILPILTSTYKKSIKKEACWIISNITAGNTGQIQQVIEAGIIQPLIYMLHNSEFEIKKEAIWAVSNATSGGSHDHIKFLVDQGCIKPLCDLLICSDPRVVSVILAGLENILKAGEDLMNQGKTGGYNIYAQMIDDADGLEKIENLQNHDNYEIYKEAVEILTKYWTEVDDNEFDAPVDNGFKFGNQSGSAPTFSFG